MAPTKLDICNMALGFIGTRTIQASELTSSPPHSPEAERCLSCWDRARRSVLQDYPYDFSFRRSGLTPTAVPSVYSNWDNAYSVPAKALKILSVHAGTGEDREPFVIEYTSDTTSVLLTNTANAQCVYVADVEDLALWSERFVGSMTLKLATLIATSLLKNNPEKVKELVALYQATIPPDAWGEGGWSVDDQVSKLGVMNMALGLIGARMVTAVTEDCDEAVQCNLYWGPVRRAVLRNNLYRFAVHRAALVARTMPPVHGGEWSKAYTWPADALRILSVHDTSDSEARQPFAIEYMSNGKAILCNVTGAEATYIADVEDPSLWDEKFVDVMARRLALEIAPALLPAERLQGKMQELSQLYQMALPGPPLTEENWAAQQNSTRLNICNMALGYVGARTISSITENIPEAIQCSLHWDNARQSAFRDGHFPFAVQRFQLEEVDVPELYRQQFLHCYLMPECLKVVRIHDGQDRMHRIPFRMENVDGVPCIFTNVPYAQATCRVDVEDVNLWDAEFVRAMAYKLAMAIYPALKKEHPNEPQRN